MWTATIHYTHAYAHMHKPTKEDTVGFETTSGSSHRKNSISEWEKYSSTYKQCNNKISIQSPPNIAPLFVQYY